MNCKVRYGVLAILVLIDMGEAYAAQDLTLASVTAVDYYDQAELPSPGSVRIIPGGTSAEPAVQERLAKRPHELLLLAQITSKLDYSRQPYSSTLGLKGYFCQREDERVLLALPYIFSGGVDVRFGPMPARSADLSKEKPQSIYSVYLRVSHESSVSSEISFDLQAQPQDVCIRFVGGPYRAFGYSSNVISITKDQIAAALGSYRLPLGQGKK